jgi:hypothetical protein
MNERGKKSRKRSSQWAAQFLVAAELERKGYEVAFTTGNGTRRIEAAILTIARHRGLHRDSVRGGLADPHPREPAELHRLTGQ